MRVLLKRILDTLKSFCYFWALDMVPTWAVPGLFYLKKTVFRLTFRQKIWNCTDYMHWCHFFCKILLFQLVATCRHCSKSLSKHCYKNCKELNTSVSTLSRTSTYSKNNVRIRKLALPWNKTGTSKVGALSKAQKAQIWNMRRTCSWKTPVFGQKTFEKFSQRRKKLSDPLVLSGFVRYVWKVKTEMGPFYDNLDAFPRYSFSWTK